MVNQRLQSTNGTRAGSFLLGAMLIAGGWAVRSWAGQAPARPAARKPAVTRTKKPASPAAVKQAKGRRVKPVTGGPSLPASKQAPPLVAGRRDPFSIPTPAKPGGPARPAGPSVPPSGAVASGPMPPGARGLVISQLVLEGIVRLDTTNKMIAVVTNNTKRAYFLRENDAVYNGVVSKITPDAVYFQENHLDQSGQATSVEVIKRLSPGPGGGR